MRGFSTRPRRPALAAVMSLVVSSMAVGQAPAPPTDLNARDRALDGGDTILVGFTVSPDDAWVTPEQAEEGQASPVAYYELRRAMERDGVYRPVARVEPDKWVFKPRPWFERFLRLDNFARVIPVGQVQFPVEKSQRGEDYYFQVAAVGPDGERSVEVGPVGPVQSSRQLYDRNRFWMMMITIILCGSVVYWINHARKGKPLNVRKIAGLEAVDEAVGRATEMGRSCLFIPGIQDMNDIQTIAGLIVLSHVAKTAAEYDAKVEVPTARSLVMTTAQETVHASFLAAGRPDAYNEDLIYYVTDEQFGYVAYLQGMMVREKPAACFYMGSFYAESLILAETGNSIGAIQVAGTAQPAQLPFFVAACDYTLIGEEFFAASAYLSGSPEELGSLKGQDVGKVVVALGLVVGVIFMTLAAMLSSDSLEMLADFIKQKMMT